ncbi:MAG: hypothetical protein K2J20_01190 [Bacilli bacterium]|nr:hypothetical protein [Bacilli bacterium]
MEEKVKAFMSRIQNKAKKENTSLIEAYNKEIDNLPLKNADNDEIRAFLIVLKTLMNTNKDIRPRNSIIKLVTYLIGGICLGVFVGKLIPVKLIAELWYIACILIFPPQIKKTIKELSSAIRNKKGQFNIAIANVDALTSYLNARENSKPMEKEDIKEDKEKDIRGYVDKLFKLIEERFPYVPYDVIEYFSLKHSQLKGIYDAFYSRTERGIGAFVSDLEELADELIEITQPSVEGFDNTIGISRSRQNPKKQ